ncbi:MAG: hypothetical protein FWD37_03960 [Methanomassiliicoccaceae archaeon]|nr:hypothetical protein [Methanomassiliicoccaceae archaeon]
MCNDDIDIEEFVKKNREAIEKILKEQDTSAFKEKADAQKEKAEEVLKGVIGTILNPDIQRHFVKAGMEFLSGIEELLKSAPFPEKVKETVEKAYEAKETFVKDVVCDLNPDCKIKNKEKKTKKIDVE